MIEINDVREKGFTTPIREMTRGSYYLTRKGQLHQVIEFFDRHQSAEQALDNHTFVSHRESAELVLVRNARNDKTLFVSPDLTRQPVKVDVKITITE